MKSNVVIAAAFSLLCLAAQAQDDSTLNVTDDELQRYAVMMDSIDEMRIDLLADMTDMIQNNENISVDRYNELSKIIDDEAKLAEAKATPEEIKAIKDVQDRKESGTATINDAFRNMAKEYVGASSYNKIRKALKDDAELKAKYNTLLNELKADNEGGS